MAIGNWLIAMRKESLNKNCLSGASFLFLNFSLLLSFFLKKKKVNTF